MINSEENFGKQIQLLQVYTNVLWTLDLMRQKQVKVYPPQDQILRALKLTPIERAKVVIIGQDPYHGAGQANGLAFSVNRGVAIPPSLQNIFKEIKRDVGIEMPSHGDLTRWTEQGVLLLNTILTVEDGKPMSHAGIGWETMTDYVIEQLNKRKEPVIFMLWGRAAQSKETLITNPQHVILKASHPSPLASHLSFNGCKHFSKANALLKKWDRGEIDWKLE